MSAIPRELGGTAKPWERDVAAFAGDNQHIMELESWHGVFGA